MTDFWPANRTERYPRHLGVDFRKLAFSTTQKYLKSYSVPVRPDATEPEMQVAAGRHFEAHLDIDDEEAISRFWNTVKKLGGITDLKRSRGRQPAAARAERKAALMARERQLTGAFEEEEEEEPDDDPPVYCICGGPGFGEMIGCDAEGCAIEWFHLSCVGLTTTTRPAEHEKWYCPDCRARPQQGGKLKPKGAVATKKRRGGAGTGKAKRTRF